MAFFNGSDRIVDYNDCYEFMEFMNSFGIHKINSSETTGCKAFNDSFDIAKLVNGKDKKRFSIQMKRAKVVSQPRSCKESETSVGLKKQIYTILDSKKLIPMCSSHRETLKSALCIRILNTKIRII